MDDYKQQLRRLALHDDALLERAAAGGDPGVTTTLGEKRAALLRVAAAVAVDAPLPSFQHAVTHALSAGASKDEVVATLEAVTPVIGAARVVHCAPKVALALGYDVEDALEQFDE